MSVIMRIKERLTSFQIIIIGFASVILIGTVMLMLPVSSASGAVTPFADALFTATSAVCVTGLVVYDTATYWSYFGQFVILVMIQIGGLGVVTVASFLAMLAGRKISLMQRQTMQNALSAPQMGGIVRLTRFILITSFVVEIAGVLLLLPVFVPEYGLSGIWMSVFHSVSAFCNAGFDVMGRATGKFSSLTSFADNPYLTFVIVMLIIIGGLGFITWGDIVLKKSDFKAYRMQTKVIITTTLILIIVPTIVFYLFCFDEHPFVERICLSVFQAVTPRTAGFNTADYTKIPDAGIMITIILMLIGGSPGSTAGGIKTTTIAVLFANIIAVFRKRQNGNFYGRRVEDSIVKNASAILMLYASLAVGAALLISSIENLPMQTCMFETFSAIGTVGLSLGITGGLSLVSHIVLIMLMFWGRVGGLTIIYAAFSHRDMSASKYPVESIMIG
ncbi:MAG: Trk family potassium uptake protein [Butyrivibrio sp.]|uniref:TrkH family potassium uptake protein n=1 Tax=Butyrivibrio sp. TaxID=28121 RepID=UPI0025E3A2EA|nr:potassium transporter TrkG [Butyrivibrio sp.]MCR5771627.1 Trk family potassium uptake protein [Butyrivibrio sp.]